MSFLFVENQSQDGSTFFRTVSPFVLLSSNEKKNDSEKYIPIASVIVLLFAVVIHYKQYWNVGSEC